MRYEAYSLQGKKKTGLRAVSFFIKAIVVIVILYAIVTTYLASSFIVTSSSMSPAVYERERVFASPIAYGVRIPFIKNPYRAIGSPERGDIVAILSPMYPEVPPVRIGLDAIVRFVTLQNLSIIRDDQGKRIDRYSIKRIIGIPGDTVRLDDYSAGIKPRDRREFASESELISDQYQTNVEAPAAQWPEGFPFSGDLGEVTLGDGEYFLLGDNRPYSSDSRSWGPISLDRIHGKVVLRYWPFRRFGIPQ